MPNGTTNLIDNFLLKAAKLGASDIHIEPGKDSTTVRFRIDGLLNKYTELDSSLHPSAISRIKVMSDMDISEQRLPQDGRVRVRVSGNEIDLRISTIPTLHGEKACVRLLPRDSIRLKLEELGMTAEQLAAYSSIISKSSGIIIVTGPTGCGKTTTLYSTLNRISSPGNNIVTIEDPVEYEIGGVNQIQVNVKSGLTFARGLRSILRQDPDIIMVGEIRDTETAEIAVHAALTGHLVFSTLHTNDAASAMTRLSDMGVEPFLISSSIIGVLAQRLLRMICPDCKETYKPSKEALESLGLTLQDGPFYKGRGCPKCQDVGYKGRVGIFELITVNEELRKKILGNTSSEELKRVATEAGTIPLKEEGIARAKEGVTTVEEVLRVTQEEF